MRILFKYIFLGLLLPLLLSACNLPSKTPDAAATLKAVYTEQAATVQALQTLAYSSGRQTPVATSALPTQPPGTSYPSITPVATDLPATIPPLLPPSLTPLLPPTLQSPTPTRTLVAPTRTPVSYCNWAVFVKDISVPDGTFFQPGEQFIKTWRLKNIGTCTWTTSYGLVFLRGDNMNGVATTTLTAKVKPGQTIDVSVELTAPLETGSYRGYWMLRNKTGDIFGLGPTASDPFYVDIKVTDPMRKIYDFSFDYCNAVWRSGAGILSCPGDSGSKLGYVRFIKNPQLENGQIFRGPGLQMVPQRTPNGYLQGTYPPFTVQKGDRFRALINCQYLADGCDAIFRLDYRVGDGPIINIWKYGEVFEGKYYPVDTDLSVLAGQTVKFILSVQANGPAAPDRLIWAGPRIDRLGYLMHPTPVPTPTTSSPGATPSGN